MSIGENIKKLRESHKLTQEEFGKIVGVTDKAVSSWETGAKAPRVGVIQKISDYFNINKSAILDDPIESNATILPQDKIRMIPVYESVSAGFGAYADNYILEYIPLFISSDEEAHNTLCIKVQGNSMYPKIEDGDSIQVLKQDWCESGQVAIVLIDGENAVVKKSRV